MGLKMNEIKDRPFIESDFEPNSEYNIKMRISDLEGEIESLENRLKYNKSTIELDKSVWNEFDMINKKAKARYQSLIKRYTDKYNETKQNLIELDLIFDSILHNQDDGGIDPEGILYDITNQWGNSNHIQSCAYLVNKIELEDI